MRKLYFTDIIRIIETINYKNFILLFFISVLQIFFISFIQIIYLKNIDLKLTFPSIYKENLIAAFFGFIAPGMIGADSYYTYSYGKKISNYTKALSGILFLRVLGFMIILLFVIFSFTYVGNNLVYKYDIFKNMDFISLIIGIFSISIIVILLYIVFKKTVIKYYKKIKYDFIDLFIITNKRKRVLLTVILLLISFYSFSVGSRLFMANIIGIDMPILKLGSIILIVNFILMIPVSISGIGVREGGFIGLLSLYNIPLEKAFLLSFFDFSITAIAALLGGSILLYRLILRKK